MKSYKVKKNDNILNYLISLGFSRHKIKSLIKYNSLYVNDNLVDKLTYIVNPNDVITIQKGNIYHLDIVYEDKNYLVVNKECGLLTISTSSSNKKYEDTLYKHVRAYLNSKKEYAYIVNRIDKETSGLVIFVKNEKLKVLLQDNWNNIVLERKYIAVVSGKIDRDGRVDNYLYEDRNTFSHSAKYGKRAITNYHILKSNDKYTLLDINIETGRKNQIRVHMSEMHHPIVGDKKYYSKDNSLKRLCLHHYRISLIDPISKEKLTFVCDIPPSFNNLFK